MLYKRIPIQSQPSGAFIYLMHPDAANYIQIGVGHESANGLQLTHVDGAKVHQLVCDEMADGIEMSGFAVKTGRLAALFLDCETLTFAAQEKVLGAVIEQSPQIAQKVAEALRAMHFEAWGHPMDWDIKIASLGDGRLFWLAYDSGINKIRIGLGYHDHEGAGQLGDHAYAINQQYAAEFATDLWTNPQAIHFFGRPARWPSELNAWVGPEGKRLLAKELVRLADKVWKGDLPCPRVLTAAERKNLQRP
ncbi:hypothetical protein BAJUN_03070 [Bajunvirus bajun]|uniref:Uncharacterized protein n=1 Tax=Brevundimonas phage vB_BgoS-Bajun TaxID=2948594 RepID=A0A9E7SRR9_9CAUD|nr:hypothetical protein BAJUN_03070 [Brevundimonas phage vB_BgoS-Bajun]